jgi:hypothetical protein
VPRLACEPGHPRPSSWRDYIAKQQFRPEDRASMSLLNEAIWESVKGGAADARTAAPYDRAAASSWTWR